MNKKTKHSPKDVASWMLSELEREGELYQNDAVYEIEARFGEEFVYINERGNLAISPNVLSQFRKLTEKKVVWERRHKCWRKREDYDEPGRMQY